MKYLRIELEAFWWQGLDIQALNGLSLSEMKHILKCTAWRRVGRNGGKKLTSHPKVEVMGRLMDCRCEATCVEVYCIR